jgi:chemotaxis signal transduction protein
MRIQGDAYALRVDELAGVYAQKRIVPFPSPVPELLGLAAVRTAIVPVYDVSALLGYRGDEVPRWFALTRGARPVGLAFTEFDGSLRPRRDELVPVEGEDLKRRHLVASVRIDDELRFIVRIPSLLEQLQKHTAREDP